MKLSEICRLCLCTKRLFLPLYDPADNLLEKIHTISSRVEVSAGDGLPAQVCQQCVELVNTCYNFKLQCEKSDMTLRCYVSIRSQCEQQDEGHVKLKAAPVRQERNSVAVSFSISRYTGDVCCEDPPRVVDGDSAASSFSASSSAPEQVIFKKSKAGFRLAGCLEKRTKSVHTCNVYDVNTENSDSKKNESLQKQVAHHSGNVKGATENGHKLLSSIYKHCHYENFNIYKKTSGKILKVKSRITVPPKYRQCEVCGKSVQKLNLHMKMHTGEKPYQCSICGQRFIQKSSLQKHNTLHTGERPYSCSLCSKTFRCKSDLNQHTKLHTGHAHKCGVCEKEFTTRQNLDSHVRTHTGEKPYLCHACGMHFTQKGALTKHSRIHANDRPHQCSVCNKRFITQSALTLHFRIHTGEKPYTCAICQKSFTDRGYFMRHLMIHSGERSFVCSVCGKAFTQQISLKRHVRLHTGEKPFHCYCGESFALKRDLKRHTERLHEGNSLQ